jgi:hypothetical protein
MVHRKELGVTVDYTVKGLVTGWKMRVRIPPLRHLIPFLFFYKASDLIGTLCILTVLLPYMLPASRAVKQLYCSFVLTNSVL